MADNKVNSGLLEFSEEQKVFVALDAETSEVKKAVTIDGDGVETDIQGVQPSGKKEITSTAEVNVASYATAQVVDEDLVAGNIKKDVDILGVVGSYEPETPASDFSTAELSVQTILPEYAISLSMPVAIDDGDDSYAYSDITITNIYPVSEPVVVILYKGECKASIYPEEGIIVTANGNATLVDNVLTITGDCSIVLTRGVA